MAAVLLLAYVALEWKSYPKTPYIDLAEGDLHPDLDELPPITTQLPEPPKPKIQTPPIIEIAPDDPEIIETVIESNEPDQDTPVLDVSDIPDIELPSNDEIVPFAVIENVPVFPGCEDVKDQKPASRK